MPKKLYVGNLPFSMDSRALEDLFTPYGAVQSAQVITDRDTGRSRGFGFVEMESLEAADKAISELNGRDIDGRALVVNEARERQPRRPGGFGRDSGPRRR